MEGERARKEVGGRVGTRERSRVGVVKQCTEGRKRRVVRVS